MRRLSWPLAVAVAVTASVGPARADEAADHAKAAAAFKEARSDIAASNCAAAVPKLQESLAYEPSVGAHLSLADCYEQVDLVATWRELQEAADLATAKNDPRSGIAHDRAVALEPKLTMMHFVYAPPPADLTGEEVLVDGAAVKPLLLRHGTLPTTPGTHDVQVTFPRKKPWHGQIVARSAGTSVDVNVALEDEGAPAPPPVATAVVAPPPPQPLAPPSSGSGQRTAAYITGGAGIAGIVVGVVFGLVALHDQSDLKSACGGDVLQCQKQPGDPNVTGPQSSAKSAGNVSTVAFIVGGVALATGVVIFATAPSGPRVEVGLAGPRLTIGGRFE
ncbi:MAG TPA: hypothetical protein VHV30_02980 [Polyangiaceae bacterium]|jgi:hypothetical protein|nr:hypothetical protein [Polyangiaceae bacterium]